jgi:glycosyltransferase involved in cell wall biosynthesis
MRIVHCLFTLRTGGAQILMLNLLNELATDHDVSLIVVNDQHMPSLLVGLDARVKVYFTNRREGSRNPLPILQLNWLLYQLKPDIIHCHERKMVQLLKVGRAKTVYTVHDVHIPTDTFSRYSALVAISDAVAMDVQQRTGLPIHLIHNGVPVDRFTHRTTYTLSADEPMRIVQVSRLVHEKKGQHLLLHALADLVHHYGLTRLQIDFVGEGPSLVYLEQLTRTLKIEPYVRFVGNRDWVWVQTNLSTYHVLIQPSIYEGFGLTVVEGMAAGLPVIVSDAGGPAEIVRSMRSGLLFATEDAKACADTLAQVYQAYRNQTLPDLVGPLQLPVHSPYALRAMAEQYMALYHRLLPPRDQSSTTATTIQSSPVDESFSNS